MAKTAQQLRQVADEIMANVDDMRGTRLRMAWHIDGYDWDDPRVAAIDAEIDRFREQAATLVAQAIMLESGMAAAAKAA